MPMPAWDDKTTLTPGSRPRPSGEIVATGSPPMERPSWDERTARTPSAPSPMVRRQARWDQDKTPVPGMEDELIRAEATRPTAPAPPEEVAPEVPGGRNAESYIGTIFADRYRIIKKLGEGGMGVVFLAEHITIEKKVALKVLSEEHARKQDLVQRFMQEAKAASRIGHENIVDITDFGETPSGSVFFAMEFLDGADVATELRAKGPMPFARARNICTQICRALGAAHAKGIIHRDMKPENVFLVEREGREDFVKILDFGIAKMSSLDSEGGGRLTRTGMIFGTPEYMSPEQARGDRPDHRVDIYAVGCILYEMLSGDVPFRADTFMGVLTKHMFEPPEPLNKRAPQANVAPDVEAVVMKALAKDRDQRFQSMKQFSLALASCGGLNASEGWGDEPSLVMTPEQAFGNGIRLTDARAPAVSGENGALESPNTGSTVAPGPAGSRLGIILALVITVVALGAGGALWFLRKQPPPKKDAQPPVVVVQPPVVPVKPVLPPPPTRAKVKFTSDPEDAQVFQGELFLGVTPFMRDFPIGQEAITLTVKKPSFKDVTIEFVPSHDQVIETAILTPKKGSKHGKDRRVKPSDTSALPRLPQPKANPKLRDLKDPFSTN